MGDELVPQQLVFADDHLRMTWANGQGQTIELLRYPNGSSLDDMEFRISVANINQAGPFSQFPGLERKLLLLDPSEIVLDIDGESKALSQFGQLAFDGESATELTSLTTPARDLNVMCRKGMWSCTITLFHLDDHLGDALEPSDVTVWIFAGGNALDAAGRTLESLDMSISREIPQWSGTGAAILIDLCRT